MLWPDISLNLDTDNSSNPFYSSNKKPKSNNCVWNILPNISKNKPEQLSVAGLLGAEFSTPQSTKTKNPTPNFSEMTIQLNKFEFPHTLQLLKIAQDSLGLYEITSEEYLKMKKENRHQAHLLSF